MSSKSNRKTKKPQRATDPARRDFAVASKLVNSTMGLNRSYMRRVCAVNTVVTNGSGVIVNQDIASSASITSFPDWSALTGLYTQYRAVAVRVTLMPYFPVNTTSTVVPATVLAAPWRGGLRPTSLTQFLESSNVQKLSGYKQYELLTHFEGDNDAHLWTQTTGAISASESFGIAIVGQSVGATASTNVWNLLVEWLVEFRVAG